MSDIDIDDPRSLARDREELGQMHEPENAPQVFTGAQTAVVSSNLSEAPSQGAKKGKRVPRHAKRAPLANLSPQGLAALDLAHAGLPVFPCGPNKHPLTKAGFKDATLDLDQVTAWWMKYPNAMIGVPTGEPSGLFVVDLDVDKKTGDQIGVASLRRIAPELLDGQGCTTQSGGRHLYFRHQRGLRSTARKIWPGVDTRGDGGYVIVPPSWGEKGQYRLLGPVDWRNLPHLPAVLARPLFSQARVRAAASSPSLDEVREILDYIDPDCSYQDWVTVLMGLHTQFGGSDRGLDIAEDWSSRGQKYVPGEIAQKWAGFVPAGGTAWSSVCDLARQTGANLAEIAKRHRGEKKASPTARRVTRQPTEARFFSAASLDGLPLPERKWLVRDLIPSGTVTLLGGDGGTGKSLLALQLAVAVATSTSWLSRGVLGGNAVFLSAEDDQAELHRRLADIVRAAGLTLGSLANLALSSLAGEDALLATLPTPSAPLEPTALYDQIAAIMTSRKPELLVLDTLADLFPGNENDRAQARQFIGLLRKLSIEHDCAVLLLAHPSLSGMNSGSGTSGSTGWNNSVRSRLYFERVVTNGYEPDHNARVLRTMKANYGSVGGEIAMKWQNGAFVADHSETGLDRLARNAKAERVFLKLLRLHLEQGRNVNASSGPNFAPAAFEKHPDRENMTKQAFRTAMDNLLSAGEIVVKEGKRSKYLDLKGR